MSSSNTLKMDRFLDVLLIFAMFEKIRYGAFYMFDILAILFVIFYLACIFLNNGKIAIRDKVVAFSVKSRLLLFLVLILQSIVVANYSNNEFFQQYIKGLLYIGVYNYFLCIAIILFVTTYSRLSLEDALVKLGRIGFVNILYNIIQFFYPDIDSLIFKQILHSTVNRYGTDIYGVGIGRLTGLFTDSNNNAAFLIIYFICIYTLIKTNYRRHRRGIYYAVLIITALELVLTYSRTGWLAFAACILFILYKEGILINIKLVILLALGVLAGIYAYNNVFVFNHLMSGRIGTLTQSSHLRIASEAFKIIGSSPLYLFLGVGVNCLAVYYGVAFDEAGMKAHSLYIQSLVEYGLFGLILTLCFWGSIFYMSYKASKTDNKIFGVPIVVLSFLVANLTYDSAFQPLAFWVVILACIAYRDKVINGTTSFD